MNLKSLHAAFYAFKLEIENKIFTKIVKINLVSIFLYVSFFYVLHSVLTCTQKFSES